MTAPERLAVGYAGGRPRSHAAHAGAPAYFLGAPPAAPLGVPIARAAASDRRSPEHAGAARSLMAAAGSGASRPVPVAAGRQRAGGDATRSAESALARRG